MLLGLLHFFRVSVRIQPADWSHTDRRHPWMRSQSKSCVAIGFTPSIKYKVLIFLHWWWTNITRWIQQQTSCLTPLSDLLRRIVTFPAVSTNRSIQTVSPPIQSIVTWKERLINPHTEPWEIPYFKSIGWKHPSSICLIFSILCFLYKTKQLYTTVSFWSVLEMYISIIYIYIF